MKGICNPEESIADVPPSYVVSGQSRHVSSKLTSSSEVNVPGERKREIEAEVASWQFSAHDFTDDELVYAASSMMEHALQFPELEAMRISTGKPASAPTIIRTHK